MLVRTCNLCRAQSVDYSGLFVFNKLPQVASPRALPSSTEHPQPRPKGARTRPSRAVCPPRPPPSPRPSQGMLLPVAEPSMQKKPLHKMLSLLCASPLAYTPRRRCTTPPPCASRPAPAWRRANLVPVAQESVDLVAGTKVVRAVVDPEEWAQVPDDQQIADITLVDTVRAAAAARAHRRPLARRCSQGSHAATAVAVGRGQVRLDLLPAPADQARRQPPARARPPQLVRPARGAPRTPLPLRLTSARRRGLALPLAHRHDLPRPRAISPDLERSPAISFDLERSPPISRDLDQPRSTSPDLA